jgi:O-acetyl-ADP-ribose deacetylase (regulator of RNase III)
MGEGDEDAKLRRVTRCVLETADKHNLKSIAFPAVSTGIFGFPMDRCADAMLSALAEYCNGVTAVERVAFCLFDQNAYESFEKRLGAADPRE